MRIVSVVPFSPGSDSATVTVTDGKYVCRAFCHPCDVVVGAELNEPLQLFNESLMRTDKSDPDLVSKSVTGFDHHGVALVIAATEQLLAVGGLRLKCCGSLPGGISSGDMVEFDCDRIDLY